jgi:hypothetical protein
MLRALSHAARHHSNEVIEAIKGAAAPDRVAALFVAAGYSR